MNDTIKQDILNILHKSHKLIEKEDIVSLKELSDHTIHDASIFQDEDSTSTAVLIYTLSKIFERTRYRSYKEWPFVYKTIIINLKKAEHYLTKNKIQAYRNSMQNIFKITDKLGIKLKTHLQEIIKKAKIAKASRIHEHGISIGRTAQLLGISEWELMEQVGKTGISDISLSLTKKVTKRLNFTRSLFE